MAAELESGLLQYERVIALQSLQNGKTPLQTVLQEKQEPPVSWFKYKAKKKPRLGSHNCCPFSGRKSPDCSSWRDFSKLLLEWRCLLLARFVSHCNIQMRLWTQLFTFWHKNIIATKFHPVKHFYYFLTACEFLSYCQQLIFCVFSDPWTFVIHST